MLGRLRSRCVSSDFYFFNPVCTRSVLTTWRREIMRSNEWDRSVTHNGARRHRQKVRSIILFVTTVPRLSSPAPQSVSRPQLKNYYTMSICTPARASLMTGRYVIRYGLQYNVIQPGAPWGMPLTEKVWGLVYYTISNMQGFWLIFYGTRIQYWGRFFCFVF